MWCYAYHPKNVFKNVELVATDFSISKSEVDYGNINDYVYASDACG